MTGKPYYFNATTGQAVWRPPQDGVTHEAERLLNPSELSPDELEKYKNEKAALSFDTFELMSTRPAAPVAVSIIPESTEAGISLSERNPQNDSEQLLTPAEIEERINAIASQKHQQLLQQQKANGNKRFKSQSANETEEVTEYQKMVNNITAQAGMKSEESGKWLVR